MEWETKRWQRHCQESQKIILPSNKSWFTVAYTDAINCSCQPQELRIEEPVVIRDVFCGVDGTMFLTDVGSVYACGSNSDNKLGLNNRQGFIMAMKNIFTKVCVLRIKILIC